MTDWSIVFLGVMSAALVVMTVVQVLVALSLLKASQQMTSTVAELHKEIRPLIEKAHRISDDAARATALALAQVERIDRMITTATTRVEETFGLVQGAIIEPMRQGAAVIAGVRAAIAAFRTWQERRDASREDEEALFVG